MTPCPICHALRLSRCATHGEWCFHCTKSLSCPACPTQSGAARIELLAHIVVVASIFASMWLALVLFS